MKKEKLLRQILFFIVIGFFVFFVFISRSQFDKYPVFLKEIRVSVFSNINIFSLFLSKVKNINSLTKENIFLTNENNKLNALLASQNDLKDQNNFLRDLLDLEFVSGRKFIDARIFNMQFTPGGHRFLINKGSADNIKVGGIVLSSSGILIGSVSETEDGFSRANLVTHLDFKITIRVLGKNTIGIARGVLNDGLQIDFISQNDDIVEGDIIVSNGNDMFPAGLLIGRVKKITSNDDGALFKKVTFEPEFKKINVDRVLILSQ